MGEFRQSLGKDYLTTIHRLYSPPGVPQHHFDSWVDSQLAKLTAIASPNSLTSISPELLWQLTKNL